MDGVTGYLLCGTSLKFPNVPPTFEFEAGADGGHRPVQPRSRFFQRIIPVAQYDRTDYTYDPAHGMVLTETAPAVNGVRAQTRYTYTQRNAWIKTSGGSFAQAATPLWLLTQKSLCRSGAASGAGCVTPSDEVRTAYDYGPDSGPNNLLLRGTVEDSAGLSLRTCYTYDAQGNKVSETKPLGTQGSCP